MENTVSSSRGLQGSGNTFPKDWGIQAALERQQSKAPRAWKKKWSEDIFDCSTEIMLDEKRVNRIRRNTKEMRIKTITLKYFFFSVFSQKTRSRYWQIHRSSSVFSLKAEVL